ncbi:MAG: YeeE/YedE family protein [Armatimonadota bacterium]
MIRVHPHTASGLVLMIGGGLVMLYLSREDPAFGVFSGLGLAIGFIMQRSRFCFTAAFRDLYMLRSGRVMKGVIVGMAVATVGFGLVMANLLPNPTLGTVAPEAHANPVGVHLVLGGILFGIGMVAAGGCTSGSLYRMGEGYAASWVAFAGILAGLGLASHTWNWWWKMSIGPASIVWFPAIVGYGGSIMVTLAGLLAAYLLVVWIESRSPTAAVGAPDPQADTLLPSSGFVQRVADLYATVFRRGWPAITGGLLLGIINVFLYTAHMPWRIVGEYGRWANGLLTAAGLGPGSLLGTERLAGCALRIGGGILTHGLLLNVGLFGGSLISALLAREFKLRFARNRIRYAQSLGGGLLMGYGAGLGMGCTVGAFFSAVPSLALNGWIFGLALAGGAYLGTYVIRALE